MSKENTPSLTFASEDELRSFLQMEGIPVEQYGAGEAKTLGHLFQEITSGECLFYKSPEGLVREVWTADIYVYYHDRSGARYRLREEKQTFQDGRERKRVFPWSLSEKMGPDEMPEVAALRGLAEELGITDKLSLHPKETKQDIFPSNSFPGLITKNNQHFFEVTLDNQHYRREGYTEQQPDKTTQWVWEKIN